MLGLAQNGWQACRSKDGIISSSVLNLDPLGLSNVGVLYRLCKSATRKVGFFILLTHEGSHREIYWDFQSRLTPPQVRSQGLFRPQEREVCIVLVKVERVACIMDLVKAQSMLIKINPALCKSN